jgi:hypothetical protein
MVWLPWKSKKKALETNEKSRERQDGAPAKQAPPAGRDAEAPKASASQGAPIAPARRGCRPAAADAM